VTQVERLPARTRRLVYLLDIEDRIWGWSGWLRWILRGCRNYL